ncbi:phage tail protein [Consotaella aegiceratis]|uniref:phage tail protein n=1 Tax=Consotaella aegiceratis TaxID=3097961 RepID=UPI002F42AB1C
MPFLAPAIAAVAGALGAGAGLAATIGQIGAAAIGIGLSVAAQALKKTPETETTSGTKLEVQYGADVERQIAVGLVAVAGHDIYTNTYGGSNKKIQKVFELSDSRITAVTRIAINGYWYSLDLSDEDADRGYAVIGTDSDNDSAQGHIRFKIYDGTQTAADPNLIEEANPSGRWTENHVGIGISYVVVTAEWDDEDMSSFPQFLFEFQGAPLYDLRKDDTVGGAGSHRWDDPTTWEYSENPIVQSYNYERGFFIGDELIMGKGMPASDLPPAAWMSAMNVCDEAVDDAARYRSGFIFSAGDGVTHTDNLEPVLNAAAAMLVEKVDGDYPIVGANQPVVATLTDDDLIVDASRTFQAKRSRTELVNAVFGSFNKPDDLWSSTSYEPQINETAQAADRERHAVPLDFEAVDNEGQAIRLADIAIRENRYQASATITVRPRWVRLEVGDWITWTSARYGNRTYRVVGRSLAPMNGQGARNVNLSLQEIGNGVYDSSVTIPERTVRVGQAAPVYTSTLPGFGVLPTTVTSEDGRTYPALYAYWTLIDDVTVDSVVLRYWNAADDSQKITKVIQLDHAAPQTDAILAEGVLPRTQYEIEGTVVANPPRGTTWAGPVTVTTGDEDLTVRLVDLEEDVQEVLAQGQEDFDAFRALIESLSSSVALSAGHSLSEVNRLNGVAFDLSGGLDETGAALIAEQQTRQTADDLAASQIEGAVTRIGGLEDDVVAQSAAQQLLESRTATVEGLVDTQGQAITAVQSSLGDVEGQVSGQATALDQYRTEAQQTTVGVVVTSSSLSGVESVLEKIAGDSAVSTAQALIDAAGQNDLVWKVTARVATEETTRASETAALASRTTVVETGLSNAQSNISGVSQSVSQLTSATQQNASGIATNASNIQSAQSSIGGLQTTANNQATALNSLQTTVTQQGTDIEANASALIGVQAQVDEATAEGLIRFEAVAAPSGVSARLSIQVRATAGGGYTNAGLYLDVLSDGTSRIVQVADQIIFSNGATPFVYEDSVAKLNIARFNQLVSGNGKLVIDGVNGTISIYD